MSEPATSRIAIPRWRVIATAWGLVALAYTPAVWLTSAAGKWQALGATLGAMLLFFVPWAVVTPAVLAASARLPLGAGRTLRSLGWIAAMGLILIPAVTLLGLVLDHSAAWLAERRRFPSPREIAQGALITSFFSVPIYVAVIGIGQALLWAMQTRDREQLRANARLDALRAQINPHFLFNALAAIGELAHRDANVAQTATARLADVLRATLTVETADQTLAEEIAIVKDHVELYRLLLPGTLDFRVSASPAAWSARVPTLILQPLIENALVHALARVAEGRLSIVAKLCDRQLSIMVENSIPERVQPSRGAGSGIANVRERLATVYGASATLMTNVHEGQFVATVTIPFTGSFIGGGEASA